jgi:branched-subunit amino acid ABC-type transport system permease component
VYALIALGFTLICGVPHILILLFRPQGMFGAKA